MNGAESHRAGRRRDRESFRVVPQDASNGEQLYAVIGPTGAALYTFTDMHVAIVEAAELNAAGSPAQATSRSEACR
jgi:hypothetical protein